MFLTVETVGGIPKCDHSNATGQTFPVVPLMMFCMMVITFESVDEILIVTFKLKLLSSTFL